MRDSFGRTIDYLRVSVTEECCLNCDYCPPPVNPARSEPLTFPEIEQVVREAVALGVHKVRLTGGEPLLRPGLSDLVARLASLEGIRDLALTTNGILLADYAEDLARAGLMRVNVSLDALDPDHFHRQTGGGDVASVLEGIQAAVAAGLTPVKLNCVVRESSREPHARDVAEFGRERGLAVRYIRRMDLVRGRFSVVEGGAGGDCDRCNRLRLSCDGIVHPCLFSELRFDARALGITRSLREAVRCKPRAGSMCTAGSLRRIGG